MKTFQKLVRVMLVALASAGTVFSSPVWAKGPGGPGAASSHSLASPANRMSTNATTLKPNSSNQVTPAPNGNTGFTGIGVSKTYSTNTGSTTAAGGSSLGVFSSLSPVANQKATNSGIIIIGGKNVALNSNFKPGDAVSLNPQPLPPKVAFVDKFSNSSAALSMRRQRFFGRRFG